MYVNNIRSKDVYYKSYNSDDNLSKFYKLEAMCNRGILHNRLQLIFYLNIHNFLDLLKVKLIKKKIKMVL